MTSPFPGMDPFLEGERWPDLHHTLIVVARKLLEQQLPERYYADIERYHVEDTEPENDIGIMYPDVAIFEEKIPILSEPQVAYGNQPIVLQTPPTFTLPSVDVRISKIAVRSHENKRLVTTIEVLSPVNKRSPGLEPFLKKQRKLRENGVHLIELDLLRRGSRTFKAPKGLQFHYAVTVARAYGSMSVWAMSVREKLPVIFVPLLSPDKDVMLDIGLAFNTAFEDGNYAKKIRYQGTPPPPQFSEADRLWMTELLKNRP